MSSYGFSPLSLYIPFGIGRAAGWPDLFLLNNKIFLLYKFFTGNRNCLTIKGCLRIPKKKKKKKHFAACFLLATIDLAHSIRLDLAGKGLGWIKRFSFQLFPGISAPFVMLFLPAGVFSLPFFPFRWHRIVMVSYRGNKL